MESFERTTHTLFSCSFEATVDEFRELFLQLRKHPSYRKWHTADTMTKGLNIQTTEAEMLARRIASEETEHYLECVDLVEGMIDKLIAERRS